MIGSRIGLPFPEKLCGTVHSVFRHSVNIQIQGDVHLYTVHSFEDMILPGSVYAQGLVTDRIRPGDRAERNGAALTVSSEQIYISPRAELFNCRISCIERKDPQVLELIRDPRYDGDDMPESSAQVYGRLHESMNDLMSALGCRDAEAVKTAAENMIGLGFGLTPSGDDMLCGALAVLGAFAPEAFRMMCDAVRPGLGRTNDISASFLAYAMDGCVNSLVLRILEGIDSVKAQDELAKKGHTSGRDILCGMAAAAGFVKENHIC